MSRILVTGANGFVGGAVCRALAGRGDAVVAATRATIGDIGPETDWTAALDGVEAVIHLAARVHLMEDPAADPLGAFRRVNRDGTRRLAERMAAAGTRRLVFVSSIKVNGEYTGDTPFSANDPAAPSDPYGVSKWEAEEMLRTIAARTGLEVAILRPPLVYGPGARANFLALMRLVDRGWPLPLGAVENRRSLIFLDNLADAILCCLDRPAAAGGTWLARDGEDISVPDLIRRLARHLGRPARLPPVPPSVLRWGAAMMGRGDAVARLTESLRIDDGPLRRDLGWRPPVSLDEGLAATAAWYRRTHA